jgi:hypothetical protein
MKRGLRRAKRETKTHMPLLAELGQDFSGS